MRFRAPGQRLLQIITKSFYPEFNTAGTRMLQNSVALLLTLLYAGVYTGKIRLFKNSPFSGSDKSS